MKAIATTLLTLLAAGGCGQPAEPPLNNQERAQAPLDNQAPRPEPAPPRVDSQPQPAPEAEQILSASDAARPVRLRTGERTGVSLSENASIGYSWSTTSVPDNLREIAASRISEPGEPRPGAGHGVVFRFEAVRAGRGRLRFERDYRGQPDEQLSFEVIVVE